MNSVSDVVWYSRLLVWVGCGGLLIESIWGRSTTLVTLLSVVFLAVGFVVFVGSLALGGRSFAWIVEEPEFGEPAYVTSRHDAEDSTRPAPEQADCDDAPVVKVAPREPTVRVEPEDVPPAAPIPSPIAASSPERHRVETREVLGYSTLVGTACPYCKKQLSEGDLSASCWRCGSAHHASCWIENRFHCGVTGCSGAASLEAPVDSDNDRESDDRSPVGGPSKP